MKAVDANVIIHGRGLSEQLVTVQQVLDELKSDEAEVKRAGFDVRVERPSEEALRRVREKADDINARTSSTDQRLVALALERGYVLLSDDRELQNLGLHLGVDVKGFLDEMIEETREWVMVCPVCGSETDEFCCREPERKVDRREQIQK